MIITIFLIQIFIYLFLLLMSAYIMVDHQCFLHHLLVTSINSLKHLFIII